METNSTSNFYEIPSVEVLQHRKIFYALKRESGEQITVWLNRVQTQVKYCEFRKFQQYLVIDKFMCELGQNDLKFLERSGRIWSLDQLNKCFNVPNRNSDVSDTPINYIDPSQDEIASDTVKSETPVCFPIELKYIKIQSVPF